MAALELPTEQRGAYLDAECADDAERAVVDELLDASLKADAYFDEFEQQLRPAADDSSGGIIGRRIGPYKIESFIGRGGMGTVYRAERADGQFSQEVAIKLLALGAMNRDAHRRFLAEREILARLQHPNIGRLLDGGVTEDGTPYFVMELVRGRRIDLFCDHEGLGVDERLRVFLQVCDAVAYAHDNNVVHRDLKPANILVSGEDVKLLDFGIAKLLPTDDGTRLTETGTGLSPMTPAYASPEQLRAQPITASTDVYALGVVLHELLVGMSPYERGKDSSVAMVQAICERPVPAPSTRLRRLGGEETRTKTDAQGIADARRTSIVQLSRRIRGDLDTILLKALRKEPEQRYASVRAFAEDIRRHLEGFPVYARPESRTYRASRFIGRHKIASTAAAVAAFLALGLIIVAVIFARTSEKQTRDLTQEQDLSRELLSQLTDLYEAADPTASPGATAAARKLLDKAVERLREQKSGDPLTRATLLFHAGRVYDRLGATSEARPLLTESYGLRTEHLSEPCEELEEVTYVLGSNEVRGGAGETGVRRMEEALEIAREVHGDDHVHVAQIRFSIGRSYHDTGVSGDAGTMFREAVRIYREHVPEPTTEYVDVLISLSDLTSVRGDVPKAIEYVREALDINLELNGEIHPLTGRAYNRLGMLSYNQGQREEGLGLLRQSVDVQRAVYGDVPHYDLAVALQNTGRWLAAEGDWDGVAALGEAAEIYAAQDEVDGSTLGFCQMLLGDALRSFGDGESAALAYEDALASYQRYGVSPSFQVQTKSKLASVLRQKGRSERAIELLGEVADTYATMFDEDHPRVVEARAELERARQ